MTTPIFPFDTRLHSEALSLHRAHHTTVADPWVATPEKVKAWHLWRQPDSETSPTKFKEYLRNGDNSAWLFVNAWYINQTYADGQVPVADADGYFLPGDVAAGGGESGPLDGSGIANTLAKWVDTNTIENSSVTENANDLTSTKPIYLPAASTSVPSVRLPHGSAPSSPTNGDVWTTSAGIFVRINGSTVGPLGAGGGGGWTQVVDEDGSSFADFTGVAGTWNSTGAVIRQTDISASWKSAILTAKQAVGAGYVFEADVKIVSGSSGLRAVGLVVGCNSSLSQAAISVNLRNDSGTTLLNIDRHNADSAYSAAFAFNEDTFYTLRAVFVNGVVSVFVDGTLAASAQALQGILVADYVGFVNYNCEAHYQIINGWRLLLPGE